jgi:hypothetical protein
MFEREELIKFWSKVIITNIDDCWIWIGHLNGHLTPNFYYKGKYYTAQRYIYQYYNEVIPSNIPILRKCNNKLCVNPEHMHISIYEINNRFWEKVDIPEDWDKNIEKCWNWTGYIDNNGYGIFRINHKTLTKAHRFSYSYYLGNIPDGLCVCHHCDNSICVNPNHLFVGTILDNNVDRNLKGRSNPLKGDENPCSKLTSIQVSEIRKKIEYGQSCYSLAKEYGMGKTTILKIKNYESWTHI